MKKFLSLLLIGSVSLGAALLYQGSTEATAPAATQKKFSRGIKGYYEYWHSLQANQTTGKVDMKDVLQARQQANAIYAQKSGSLLQWDFMGPDNVGGRTRALIVDKDNANKLVAGGVSGGLWRSDNAGANWTQITYDPNMQIIACIAQDASGDYYAGTGEGFYNGFYPGDGTMGFLGNGILKSTDGANSFSQVISTYPSDENNSSEAWGDVRAIAAHPTIDNKIYAVLSTGLRMSSDGGSTWTNVQNGAGYDVVAGSDGVIHAIIGNAYYRSDSNGDNFQSVANFSGARKRLAVCESQPNMVYMVSVSGGGGCLNEVQRSTDGGSTWTKIGEGTESFEPMANGAQCQGDYDLAFAAHPTDGNRIFLAGVTLWSYSTSDGWRQIDNLDEDPSNPAIYMPTSIILPSRKETAKLCM
ncbi:MAG: hypothetical protein IPL35_04405 [Sphingobacteriales bacterium]|nr:hypothetical protein [Sphingobacteriales bacterium]